MQIVIQFYRIRETDNAHAVVGQEIADAADLDGAIEVAVRLCRTLNMPQRPDGVSIVDSDGHELYSRKFDPSASL